MAQWQFLNHEYVHENPWYKIRREDVVRPNGKKGEFFIVEAPHGVFVIPETADHRIVLIKHFRPTTKMESWEIVAGAIDGGEQPLVAAKRELAEETGYNAKHWRKLTRFQQLPGKYSGMGHIFLAQGLQPFTQHEQEEEGILDMREFSLAEIMAMIKSQEITDGPTLAAFMHYFLSAGYITV